ACNLVKGYTGVVQNTFAGFGQSDQTDAGITFSFFFVDQTDFLHRVRQSCNTGGAESNLLRHVDSSHRFFRRQRKLTQNQKFSETDAVQGEWAEQTFLNAGM